MRKHIPIVLSIAVLFGVMTIGCNSNCTADTSNDFFNCGKCSNACAAGKACKAGTCTDLEVGGVTAFGQYNQSPIQWYILDKDAANHRVMLLSMDTLHKICYNRNYGFITWAESKIRSWLNGYFISSAFTSEERARIPSVQIVNANNPMYGTPGGVDTTDKVFLLSIDEVETLLGTTKEDICSKIHCGIGSWWLRSPGERVKYGNLATSVASDGKLKTHGEDTTHVNGVRPAMWLEY